MYTYLYLFCQGKIDTEVALDVADAELFSVESGFCILKLVNYTVSLFFPFTKYSNP